MPPLLPVLKLARLPAVLDRLAPAARVELDAHAFAQDAAVGAGIRSQGRTLLDPVDREILNVVSTGFPSESAPEEESPFEHETFPLFKWSKEPMGSSSGASNVAIRGRCDHRPLPPENSLEGVSLRAIARMRPLEYPQQSMRWKASA